MSERYEITEIEARHDRMYAERSAKIVASDLGADEAIETQGRMRASLPQGSSVEYRIRKTA